MAGKMNGGIDMLEDAPEENNIMFGFGGIAERAACRILYPDVPEPFMAVDGEPGSGKTTLMRLIKRRVNEADRSARTIEFKAWNYDWFDTLSALSRLILGPPSSPAVLKIMAHTGRDIRPLVARMNEDDAISHLERISPDMVGIGKVLSGEAEGRLVIFLDNMDQHRGAYNVNDKVKMLEDASTLLKSSRVSIVAAIDLEKAESEWNSQPGGDTDDLEGRMRRMCLSRLKIPPKDREDMIRYICSIAPVFKNRAKHMADLLPPNPRRVKQALNLVSRVRTSRNPPSIDRDWPHLIYSIMAWFSIRDAGGDIVSLARAHPRELVCLAWLCSYHFDHVALKNHVELAQKGGGSGASPLLGQGDNVVVSAELVTDVLLEMARLCSGDPSMFEILRQYGLRIRDNIAGASFPDSYTCMSNARRAVFEPAWDIFRDAVDRT